MPYDSVNIFHLVGKNMHGGEMGMILWALFSNGSDAPHVAEHFEVQ
jgi:hypothetical protein